MVQVIIVVKTVNLMQRFFKDFQEGRHSPEIGSLKSCKLEFSPSTKLKNILYQH